MIFYKSLFKFLLITLLFNNTVSSEDSMKFSTNTEAPLKVNANSMFIDKVSLEGGLSGSVNINQGPLDLKSDQMSFIFTNNEEMPIITNLFASQNVMISNEDMTASGNNASYSVRKNEILLEGNVVVKNKFTTMRGEKLFIDLETGKINFLSDDKQNNRIRGQLLENDKKSITLIAEKIISLIDASDEQDPNIILAALSEISAKYIQSIKESNPDE